MRGPAIRLPARPKHRVRELEEPPQIRHPHSDILCSFFLSSHRITSSVSSTLVRSRLQSEGERFWGKSYIAHRKTLTTAGKIVQFNQASAFQIKWVLQAWKLSHDVEAVSRGSPIGNSERNQQWISLQDTCTVILWWWSENRLGDTSCWTVV